MKKLFVLVLAMAVGVFLLSACAPAQGVTQRFVELPEPIQAVIGLGVLYLVGLALRGRIPDEYVMEISATITTAIVAVIGVLLRLIPLEFESVANAVLNLIVVLLGMLTLVRGLFVVVGKKNVAQRFHLLK